MKIIKPDPIKTKWLQHLAKKRDGAAAKFRKAQKELNDAQTELDIFAESTVGGDGTRRVELDESRTFLVIY